MALQPYLFKRSFCSNLEDFYLLQSLPWSLFLLLFLFQESHVVLGQRIEGHISALLWDLIYIVHLQMA
jgi:hypothetical protein